MDKTDAKTLKQTVHPRWANLCKQSNLMGETNDCTVKAVALALGIPYRVAHARMAVAGRRRRRGCNFEQLTRSVLCGDPQTYLTQVIRHGWIPKGYATKTLVLKGSPEKYVAMTPCGNEQWTTDFDGWPAYGPSLARRLNINPEFPWAAKCKTVIGWQRYAPKKGTWIVRTASHILCFRDGLVGDWTAGRNHRIKNAFRVDNAPAWPEKNLQLFDAV